MTTKLPDLLKISCTIDCPKCGVQTAKDLDFYSYFCKYEEYTKSTLTASCPVCNDRFEFKQSAIECASSNEA